MPNTTSLIASGLGALVVLPVLAFAGITGSPTCAAATGITASPSPSTGTASTTWDDAQVAVGATIVAVGVQRHVPTYGQVIAIAAAMQESRLRNLPGGDADSIGVFQQRPSQGWGTPAQLTFPVYQAGKFYEALLAVPGWQGLPVAQAAQAVQRSAFPDAYARWATPAAALVNQITARSVASSGPGLQCPAGQEVLARAASWLTAWHGFPVPYSMSTDPADWFSGYRRDCSGYASMALGLPGPGLDTSGLAARSTPTSKADLQPGDLLINPALDGRGHVVIFDHWTSVALTSYVGYEQSGDGGTHHRVIAYPYFGDYPMSPYRFSK